VWQPFVLRNGSRAGSVKRGTRRSGVRGSKNPRRDGPARLWNDPISRKRGRAGEGAGGRRRRSKALERPPNSKREDRGTHVPRHGTTRKTPRSSRTTRGERRKPIKRYSPGTINLCRGRVPHESRIGHGRPCSTAATDPGSLWRGHERTAKRLCPQGWRHDRSVGHARSIEIVKREALECSLYGTILVLIMGSVVCTVVKPVCAIDLMVDIVSCLIRVRINLVRVRRLWGG